MQEIAYFIKSPLQNKVYLIISEFYYKPGVYSWLNPTRFKTQLSVSFQTNKRLKQAVVTLTYCLFFGSTVP